MIELSDEIQSIPHSPTLWANDMVWKKRSEGETVYHMGLGEAPFPVPDRLKEALAQNAGEKEYYPAAGIPELLETIREYYRPLVGNYVDECDLIVAPGSKLILFALQAAIKGDLLVPNPSWVTYVPQSKLLQTESIRVPAQLDDEGYKIDPVILRETIHAARKEGKNPTKIILNSPSNPAGTNISEQVMEEIAQVCKEEEIFIISDEIYGLVSYDGNYTSMTKYAPEISAITTGLSKHLSMGGWRFGVSFIPKKIEGLHEALCRYISETWSCVCGPVQYAAIEAYKRHEDIEQRIKDCTDIHEHINSAICEGLRAHGIDCPKVKGGFYTYPNFRKYRKNLEQHNIKTSGDIHRYLLENYNLVSLPSTAFFGEGDDLCLRLSGCDYHDRAADALKGYQAGEKLDRAFIEKYAPRILESIAVFGSFMNDITSISTPKAA